jgi:hypothetical protein
MIASWLKSISPVKIDFEPLANACLNSATVETFTPLFFLLLELNLQEVSKNKDPIVKREYLMILDFFIIII